MVSQAASVKVEIKGLGDELQANVAAYLSIVREGQRKREKSEGQLTERAGTRPRQTTPDDHRARRGTIKLKR
jgi:hypothetical protein